MYNEIVLDHYKHPRNHRVIENPDATSRVGSPICLLPQEKVHVNDEIKPIEIMSTNERILGHNGNYNEIIGVSKRDYNGKVMTLKNKLGTLSLTPEHLVFAIKIHKKDKLHRIKYRKELVPAWYHADQLKEGDITLFPILKEIKDIKFLETNISRSEYDFRSKDIPKKIPINRDFLRFCGYFLSEGYIKDSKYNAYIQVTLNINEENIANDIKEIIQKLFGLDVKIKKISKRKTITVCVYSSNLARFFKKLFGNYSDKKKIPHFMMLLPIEKQKSLIYGLWKGDGYVNLNRNGPRAGYSTISYQLSQQIKTLLLRQKIIPSIYEEPEKIKNDVKHKKNYRIHVGQRESLIKLCSILGIKYIPKSYPSVKSWIDDNYLYIPISGIKNSFYNGKVYNLEVKNTHSFTSDSFCVHNCGDVMEFYIKVKKVNGKDIIEDISFETFGCAASVAVGSMITELLKGKTLEEAEKLTDSDVNAKLGGLPEVKHHCANLGLSALHEVIKNYKNKKK